MAQQKSKTILTFIGGLNKDKIGANCQVIEHTNEKEQTKRVMIDLGSLFVPYGSEFSIVYPNIDKYFQKRDSKQNEPQKAPKQVDALFITHTHQDHIGALIDIVKMGYKLPPIYTSEYTAHCIRLSFAKEAMISPEIIRIKDYHEVKIGDIEVTPFYVSHSAVDALGFMVRTFFDNKPHVRIVDYGDFLTTPEMPIGHAIDKKAQLKMLKDKPAPMTIFEIDSTSTSSSGLKRLGFEKCVENTNAVCKKYNERNFIVSPVIAYSWNNIAIDFENARLLGTKVFFDGQGLKIPLNAMKLCGYDKYNDVIYHGNIQEYMSDKSIKKKYFVDTGAFFQGLDEYNNNISDTPTSQIWMSSFVKMALGLHPDIQLSSDYLVVARQRDIVAVTGDCGRTTYQLCASQGAKVVTTPNGMDQSYIETLQMQDSGHINAQELKDWMEDIKTVIDTQKMMVLPIHGSNEQRLATKDLMQGIDILSYFASNGDNFTISPEGIAPAQDKEDISTFFALKKIYPGMDGRTDIAPEGINQYCLIDKDYNLIEKITEVANTKQTGHKTHTSGKQIDKNTIEELDELPIFEKMKHKKRGRS